jgi:hypothetical protein
MRIPLAHCVIPAICSVVFIGGCQPLPQKSSYDQFTGTTINSTTDNEIKPGILGGPYVVLDMRQELKPESTNYFLVLQTFQIPSFGNSLLVLAGTNRLSFNFSPFSPVQGLKRFYSATPDQLLTIAKATNATIRIIALNGTHLDRGMSNANLHEFRDFVAEYVPHP